MVEPPLQIRQDPFVDRIMSELGTAQRIETLSVENNGKVQNRSGREALEVREADGLFGVDILL